MRISGVSGGIMVDEFLQTTAPNVYAAGDVSRFFNPALNERIRVEHEDNANTMGRFAGRNMAGAAERCTHLPFFYSDLFEVGYEAAKSVISCGTENDLACATQLMRDNSLRPAADGVTAQIRP
jgi:NADPH-dependent 2,4-dienoyl-CoA reductase/sulfur reductase-like enzyme